MFLSTVNLDAASVIYQFEPISPSLFPSNSSPQVQAMFTDEKPGTVQLTITSDLAGGEFLDNLYFNFDPMDNVNHLRFVPMGAHSQPLPQISTGENSFKADGGYYDICFAFGTTGKDRFSGDDSLTYLITEPGLNASDFVFVDSTGSRGGANGMYYALALIQGNCGNSQWLAASTTTPQPVPEPASLTLLASAGGLGWCVCSRSGTRRLIKNWFSPRMVS
jgi:hypothetical protein